MKTGYHKALTGLAWVWVCVCPVMIFAEADNEPKAEAVEPPPLKMTVRPQSVNIGASGTFNERGEIQNRNIQATLGISIRAEVESNVVGISSSQLTRVVTDRGRELPIDATRTSSSFHRSDRRPETPFQANLTLALPSSVLHVKSLAAVDGVLKVIQQHGVSRTVTLPPMNEIAGRDIRIEDFGDEPIVFRMIRPQPNVMIRVELTESAALRIASIGIPTPDGGIQRAGFGGGGSSQRPGYVQRYISGNVTETARLELVILEGVHISEHLFSIRNIQLPMEEERPADELIIRLPPPPAEAAEAHAVVIPVPPTVGTPNAQARDTAGPRVIIQGR